MRPAPDARSALSPVRVSMRGVGRSFPSGVVALDGIDLEVTPGTFLAILGPSGCGKSTLLRLIAGLDAPSAGSVGVTREDGAADPPSIAYVFQDAHLLPWRRVLDNAALPLELEGVAAAERHAVARAALEQVGLGDACDRYPGELSGGMRMRVSLARALVTKPDILLLDEPFAALDELTRNRLDDQLRALWHTTPMTVVFVTHSITEAAYLAERVVVMSPRPARITADVVIDLPEARHAALRTERGFAEQVRALHDALEAGGS